MTGQNIMELKRIYASSLQLPNPESATIQQILTAIDRLPEDSVVHPDDMRDELRESLPEGDPDLALFAP